MAPVLGYWDIRGLAQPVRLLLNFAEEEFEDKRYECGPGPEFDRTCWTDIKNTFGLSFPNLPYYIDGDVKLSQSNAILRHIGRKHNLLGRSPQECADVDMMLDQAMDFRNGFVRLCYNPHFNNLKEGYLKLMAQKLQEFEGYLGDKSWFVGENVTVVDFPMYELLDQHLVFEPTCLDECPKLKAYTQRFEALPQIKKYMASDKFLKEPINNKMAKFQ